MLNIVIPCAGSGQRFKDAGYMVLKPDINVLGDTMLGQVKKNLAPKQEHDFITIWQDDLYRPSQGAADTILQVSARVDNDEPLLIANCDQLIDIDINDFLAAAGDLDGLIITFPASDPKWSYAKVKDGLVTEVAEKNPISEHATVGIYYFKKGSDFVRAAEAMKIQDKRVNGEFYVCPVYNELIAAGGKVGVYEIEADQMHGLGTPEDYEEYVGKKAVLFDLDGVLVDAADWHYEALNKALAEHGYNISRSDHETKFNGLPTKRKLDMLGVPSSIRKIIAFKKQQYTTDIIRDRCQVDKDKVELLKDLRSRGYMLGCVSNAVRKSVELMLIQAGLMEYFYLVMGNEDVSKNKPDPEPYLKAMYQLAITPKHTTIVEDSPYGIAAAKASGATVIEAQYPDVKVGLL